MTLKNHRSLGGAFRQKSIAARRIRNGETRAITETPKRPSGEDEERFACCARSSEARKRGRVGRRRETGPGRSEGGRRRRRNEAGRAPKSPRGVSLDISALLARWSFSRAGWLNPVRSCPTSSLARGPPILYVRKAPVWESVCARARQDSSRCDICGRARARNAHGYVCGQTACTPCIPR